MMLVGVLYKVIYHNIRYITSCVCVYGGGRTDGSSSLCEQEGRDGDLTSMAIATGALSVGVKVELEIMALSST